MHIRTVFTRARRRLLVAAAVLAMLGGALVLAGSASAAPLHGLQPEYFTISFSGPGAGNGVAYGPVHGAFTDNEVSPTAGIWTFSVPWAKVRVDHTAPGNPNINWRTCQGFLFQRGNWTMTGLAGAYRHAFGFGGFKLWLSVTFARQRHGGCDPNQAVSESVFVIGQGLATR